MRVIDLLNKIANGEEVPERIKYDTKEMKYDHNKQDYLGYYSNGNGEWLFQYLFDRCRNTEHFINDEVEVIEEKEMCHKCGKYPAEYNQTYCEFCLGISEEDKKIEKFAEYEIKRDMVTKLNIIYKINEIIDYINKESK